MQVFSLVRFQAPRSGLEGGWRIGPSNPITHSERLDEGISMVPSTYRPLRPLLAPPIWRDWRVKSTSSSMICAMAEVEN